MRASTHTLDPPFCNTQTWCPPAPLGPVLQGDAKATSDALKVKVKEALHL